MDKVDKSPFYKKWWFWAIIVFILICIGAAGSSQNDSKDDKDTNSDNETSQVEDAELESLKLSPKAVRNDVTGDWRVAAIASPTVIGKHAYAYYKNYIKDDREVHFIVNLTLKTTTKIAKTPAGINVTVYEYVDGEEHDAKTLGSGMTLADEYYNSQTGEKFDLKGYDAE